MRHRFNYTPTRYYFRRLWKISWVAVRIGNGRLRVVKHYERRSASGKPWVHVRSIVTEVNEEHGKKNKQEAERLA